MSAIIDAVEGVISALSSLADASSKAFIAILIAIPIGAVTAALIGVSFDTVETAVTGNPAASALVDGARTTYDIGDTVQGIYENVKILWPVGVAIVAAGGAIVGLIRVIANYF